MDWLRRSSAGPASSTRSSARTGRPWPAWTPTWSPSSETPASGSPGWCRSCGTAFPTTPRSTRRSGRCPAYGRGITYRPLGEILRAHLGIPESSAPGEVLAQLGERPILGLTLGLDTAGDLHPLAARDALHQAWIDLFDAMVADRPAVVLIEDLHWAEAPLLDLLEQIVRGVTGRLLLVTTARPDFVDQRPGWGAGRYDSERIWLEQLPAEASALMLDELLGGALSDEMRGRIVARSEGNPLFIEELLGSLIDQGLVERNDGGWRVRDLPADLRILTPSRPSSRPGWTCCRLPRRRPCKPRP